MDEAPAWVAIGLSILSFGWTEFRLRSRRKARKNVGPSPDELRKALTSLHTTFAEIIASGGKDVPWFLDDGRKHLGEHLREEAARVGDRPLKESAKSAVAAWDKAFAFSPPAQGARAYPLGTGYPEAYRLADLERDERMANVSDAARAGQENCRVAIDRLNDLEAKSPEG
jgi:hypothetical protein